MDTELSGGYAQNNCHPQVGIYNTTCNAHSKEGDFPTLQWRGRGPSDNSNTYNTRWHYVPGSDPTKLN